MKIIYNSRLRNYEFELHLMPIYVEIHTNTPIHELIAQK